MRTHFSAQVYRHQIMTGGYEPKGHSCDPLLAMDSLALRKRSGKGIGDGKTKDSGDAAATSSEPSREVDTGAQGTQVLGH